MKGSGDQLKDYQGGEWVALIADQTRMVRKISGHLSVEVPLTAIWRPGVGMGGGER